MPMQPDQIAEGRLTSVSISIPVYKLKEQAIILRLASDACLEGSGEFDKVEAHQPDPCVRDGRCPAKAASPLAGKPVRVTGEPFGDHTAHHHTRVEPAARR